MKIRIDANTIGKATCTLSCFTIFFLEMFKNKAAGIESKLLVINVFLGIIVFILSIFLFKKEINSRVWFVFIITLVYSFFESLLIGQITFGRMTSVLFVFFPVALFLYYEQSGIFKGVTGIWYMLMIIYLIYSFYQAGATYFLFDNMSRNYITVYSTLALFVLTIHNYRTTNRIKILFIILYFVCSIIAIGRGGIIASIIYMTLEYITRQFYNNSVIDWKKILILCVLIFGGIIVYVNFDEIVGRFFSRFASNGVSIAESGRGDIYNYYLRYIFDNPIALLFGARTNTLGGLVAFFRGNLHNSFLMFHSYYGLFGVAFLFVIIVKNIKYGIVSKKYDYLCILLVLLVRSFSDYMFPGFLGDVAIWYLVISYINIGSMRKVYC